MAPVVANWEIDSQFAIIYNLDFLTVIIPGNAHYFLADNVEVWGLDGFGTA